jgi:hypothetical protein
VPPRQLLARLGQEHSAAKPVLDRGVAVSIPPIPPGAEVFTLPRLAGG